MYPVKAPTIPTSMDAHSGQMTYEKGCRSIKTSQQWDKAFLIFISIYNQHPFQPWEMKQRQGIELLMYMGEVKSIATAGSDFLYYDESFHSDCVHLINPFPWNTFQADLYSKSKGLSIQGTTVYHSILKFSVCTTDP